jgi:NIPSNAP
VSERESTGDALPRTVEIRAYRLKPGTIDAFDQVVATQAVPMLERWGTDVVAYGRSQQETDGYFLIRAYADLADLNARQDAFYGSDEWRSGPREAIVSRIETHLSTVVRLSAASIADLRRANGVPR